ncbi:hypothetical protein [Natranaerobius thermophilus]|uniref:Uncharacterized protein n=1 Tax=Natranaerobius thermophilus (strain ATCC BAA-1301 / DSM 18059 / JW/NM-WN-LF) TaxID=457570 RepID=B2A476_NATTJ|nr:hypothetical protein [Natranaerobius thermophilus]ACB83730.1 hypothetical protein Nther_0131 [Natranaerobius thermophilus JW/NM-WN-LF]
MSTDGKNNNKKQDLNTQNNCDIITNEIKEEIKDLNEQELELVKNLSQITPSQSSPDSDFQEQLKQQLLEEHRALNKHRSSTNFFSSILHFHKYKFIGATAAAFLAFIIGFGLFAQDNYNDFYFTAQEEEKESMELTKKDDEETEVKEEADDEGKSQLEFDKDDEKTDINIARDTKDLPETKKTEQETEQSTVEPKEKDKEKNIAEIEKSEQDEAEQEFHITKEGDNKEKEKSEEQETELFTAKTDDQLTQELESILEEMPESFPIYETDKQSIEIKDLKDNFSYIVAKEDFPLTRKAVENSVENLVQDYQESDNLQMHVSVEKVDIEKTDDKEKNSLKNESELKIFNLAIEHKTKDNFSIILDRDNYLVVTSDGDITDGYLTQLADLNKVSRESTKELKQLKEKITDKGFAVGQIKTGYQLKDGHKLVPILYEEANGRPREDKIIALVP